jgi:hypothetical protein
MRTLLITNSYDITSDLLIHSLGTEKFIRINYDRPKDWEITVTRNEFSINSAIGTIKNTEISKGFWRKPFISNPNTHPYDEKFYLMEWKFLIFELISFIKSEDKLVFNMPYPDYLLSKVTQERIAAKHFHVGDSKLTINRKPYTEKASIAKSLSGESFSDGNVLYTVDVSNKELNNDIWFIQEKIEATYDMTVVHMYNKNYAFKFNRDNLKTVDWRVEQFESRQHWEKFELSENFNIKINSFMQDLGLTYGRLDFLMGENAEDAVFLEVNKNGQWAWLDPNKDNGLFKTMISVVDPSTPFPCV